MPDPALVATLLWPALALVALSLALGAAARRVRLPRVTGAVVAGVMLGPFVLGRAAPDLHRLVFTGGLTQQRQIAELEAEHRRAVDDLRATGVTDVAIEEQQAAFEASVAALRTEQQATERAHQSPLRAAVMLLIVPLVLIEAGMRLGAGFGGRLPLPPAWLGVAAWLGAVALIALASPLGLPALAGAGVIGGVMVARQRETVAGAAVRGSVALVAGPLLWAYAAANAGWVVAQPVGVMVVLATALAGAAAAMRRR